jgi:SAM-dependent methyltransferase
VNELYDDPWFYDLQHDGYRDDLGFYRRLAEDQAGPVLELGAGTGRVTLTLARTGLPVVAVEPHPAMREHAAARLAQAASTHPELGARVRLLDGDARTLALAERFALVLAPFNALMHFETLAEQDRVLRCCRDHLAAAGAFACDVFVPRFGGEAAVRAESTWARVAGDDADLLTWQHHDPVQQVVISHHRLDAVGADGALRRRRAILRQRYYQRFELERALRAAGFGDVRCYGDFARGPVREDSVVWAFVARP